MRMLVQRDALIRELDLLKPLFMTRLSDVETVYLSAENGVFTARSTDNWHWLTTTGEARVVQAGNVRLKAVVFQELMRNLPKGEVTLESSEQGDFLTVETGAFRAKLVCPLYFPEMPKVEFQHSIKLKAEDLLAMIKPTHSVLDEHVSLAKVALLSVRDGGYRMVSTDGHRLSLSDIGTFPDAPGADLMVPRKAIGFIKSMIDGWKGDVDIAYSDSSAIEVKAGSRILLTHQAKVTYPQYQRIMSKAPATTVKVAAAALATAAKRTVLMLERAEEAILTLYISEKEIRVVADGGKEEGTASEAVECTAQGQLPVELRIRSAYLIESLYNAGAPTVTLGCPQADSGQPISVQPNGKQVTFVIMPIMKPRPAVAKEAKHAA